MTKDQLEIDFAAANNAVHILEEAGDILGSADTMCLEFMEIQRHMWQGESAQRYLDISRYAGDKWKSRRNQLADIREGIRNAARRLYETELKALEIAERRDYEN